MITGRPSQNVIRGVGSGSRRFGDWSEAREGGRGWKVASTAAAHEPTGPGAHLRQVSEEAEGQTDGPKDPYEEVVEEESKTLTYPPREENEEWTLYT